MKKQHLILAALAPLVAISGANAAMDEMTPEMRVWSAVLSEPSEDAGGAMLKITASASTTGSNGMVIESVELMATATKEGEDGAMMTEVVGSVACAGPVMVEGGMFMIEAAAMEEEGAEMAEGDEEAAGCEFAVSGSANHTYRSWHSWDLSGSVTMGEANMGFNIADQAPAMILEPEPEEEEMSDEG